MPRPSISYAVEAYLPSDEGAVQREKDCATLSEADVLARMWAAEGLEVDVVRRDWHNAQRIEYHVVTTHLAR